MGGELQSAAGVVGIQDRPMTLEEIFIAHTRRDFSEVMSMPETPLDPSDPERSEIVETGVAS